MFNLNRVWISVPLLLLNDAGNRSGLFYNAEPTVREKKEKISIKLRELLKMNCENSKMFQFH